MTPKILKQIFENLCQFFKIFSPLYFRPFLFSALLFSALWIRSFFSFGPSTSTRSKKNKVSTVRAKTHYWPRFDLMELHVHLEGFGLKHQIYGHKNQSEHGASECPLFKNYWPFYFWPNVKLGQALDVVFWSIKLFYLTTNFLHPFLPFNIGIIVWFSVYVTFCIFEALCQIFCENFAFLFFVCFICSPYYFEPLFALSFYLHPFNITLIENRPSFRRNFLTWFF